MHSAIQIVMAALMSDSELVQGLQSVKGVFRLQTDDDRRETMHSWGRRYRHLNEEKESKINL